MHMHCYYMHSTGLQLHQIVRLWLQHFRIIVNAVAISPAGSLCSPWRRQETNSYPALTLDLANVPLPNCRRPDELTAAPIATSNYESVMPVT